MIYSTSLLKESLHFIFHLLLLPDTHQYFLWGIQHKAFWELWRNRKQRAWNTRTCQSGAPKLSAAQRAAHLCKMRMRKCQRQNNIENVGETQKMDFWFKTGRRLQSCLIWVTNYPLSDKSPFLLPFSLRNPHPVTTSISFTDSWCGGKQTGKIESKDIQKIRPLANDIYLGLLFYDKHHDFTNYYFTKYCLRVLGCSSNYTLRLLKGIKLKITKTYCKWSLFMFYVMHVICYGRPLFFVCVFGALYEPYPLTAIVWGGKKATWSNIQVWLNMRVSKFSFFLMGDLLLLKKGVS